MSMRSSVLSGGGVCAMRAGGGRHLDWAQYTVPGVALGGRARRKYSTSQRAASAVVTQACRPERPAMSAGIICSGGSFGCCPGGRLGANYVANCKVA